MASAELGDRCAKNEGCVGFIRKRVQKRTGHFTKTLDHLLQILRFVKTRRGNARLIGLGRTGKKSQTRATAFSAV
jgi:hypothetical protein